jgi:hypothetical protein
MKHIKKFNEGIRIHQDIESPYTVGDLKKYISELPDDMPVIVFDEIMNEPRFSFISQTNAEELSNLDFRDYPEGDYEVLVIGI